MNDKEFFSARWDYLGEQLQQYTDEVNEFLTSHHFYDDEDFCALQDFHRTCRYLRNFADRHAKRIANDKFFHD